ncbi:MAG: autotransporter-associated beta strand repeat-containing protein [Phycisphaerae bacterium]|jgi:autotransporter-associated beta strand protein
MKIPSLSVNRIREKTTEVSRRAFLVGLLSAALVCSIPAVQAAGTWSGAAGVSEFTTPGNWVGESAPATPYGGIVMSGNTTTSPTFSANATFSGTNALVFNNTTTGSFTFSGSALTISGAPVISNTSGLLQTINNTITLNATSTLSANGTGSNLTFGGAINNSGFGLTVLSGSSAVVRLDGAISGNGTLTLDSAVRTPAGAGITLITGSNTFGPSSSGVAIYNNTAKVSNNAGLGATTLVQMGAAGGSYTSTLLTSGAITISQRITLISTGANPANTYTIGGDTADFSTFSGQIYMGAKDAAGIGEALNVTAASGGLVIFSGSLGAGALVTDSGDILTKIGAGTVALTGNNTYKGGTVVNTGTLIAKNAAALNPTTGGAVTVAAGATLDYFAAADAQLGLHSTLAITGGAGTAIGGSIGSTTTSAEINVTGAATISDAAHTVNIFGIPAVAPATGTYTLIHGGVGSSLNPTTAPTLGLVYNNTNFTVGGFTRSATDLQVGITSATALTSAFWKGGLTGATNVWAVSDGSTASNWAATAGGSAQALVPGLSADVTISATSPATAPTSTVLGQDMTIKSLTIADTANGLGLNADGSTLTIKPTSGGTGILVNAGVPASTIGANVLMGASQYWTNNSASALTVSGVVSSAGNSWTLFKSGTGTLVLSGANTYWGVTTVSAGVLNIQNSAALGNALNGTSVTAGAALQMQNNITVGAEALTLNGTGISNGGALRNMSGNNIYGGLVTLGSATRINSDAGSLTLSNTGTITGAGFALTVGGAGNSTIASAIGTTSGTLTKDGAGTLTLTAANTYTGVTTVSAGTMLVSGTLANTSGVTVSGGALQLGAAERINDAATLTLSGGALNVGGFSETLGTLTLTNATASSLDFVSGGSIILFSGITADTGTLAISNWTSGSDSLRFSSAANLLASSFTVNGGAATILNQGSYFEVVPEPATWALLAFSLTTVVILRRRRA